MTIPPLLSPAQARRPVPFDAEGIRLYGVAQWCEDFPLPVHWRDFASFVDALFDGFEKAICSVEREEQEVLIARSEFIGVLRDQLYWQAFSCWAREAGRDIAASEQTLYSLATQNDALRPAAMASTSNCFALRAAARTWVENGPLGLLARFRAQSDLGMGRNAVWSVGTMGGLKRQWLLREAAPARTVYVNAILQKARRTAEARLTPKLKAAVNTYCADVESAVDATLARGLREPRFEVLRLFTRWMEQLAATRGLIDAVRSLVRKPPRAIYLNEVWQVPHRILSLALRGLGTEIVAFSHGNDPLHVMQRQHALMAFGHSDTYVCETAASATAHAAYFAHSPLAKSFPVTFVSAETRQYVDAFEAAPPPKAVSSPPRVLVMGYPLLAHRTQYDVTNGLAMHLEAERRLLLWLRANSFAPVYKAHPETRAQAHGLFEDVADEINFEPFERMVESCDIILFLTTVSSTFGSAVCTKKPVVVLNHAGKAWNPVVADLYARRCRLVPSWIADDNRIQFDPLRLLEALQLPGPKPDFEIVSRVFTPSSWTGPTQISNDAIRISAGATTK